MTLPENVDWPVVLTVAGLAIAFLFVLFSSARGSRNKRASADAVAAVKAERDVLRANHAVEIASLEKKLAASQERVHGEMEASMRLKEAQKRVEERDAALKAHEQEIAGLKAAVTAAQEKAQSSISDDASKLMGERDEARQSAQKMSAEVSQLRDQISGLQQDLETARAEPAADGIIAQRDKTIAALRDALAKAESGAGDAGLQGALEDAKSREATANEALSRLAYDRDGLLERLNAAERVEREARAEVEKREALLELRLQKIYELEARLRDQHGQVHAAMRRAETAEDRLAQAQDGPEYGEAVVVDTQAEARLQEVEAQMAGLQEKHDALVLAEASLKERNDTLTQENELLRKGGGEDGDAVVRAISSAEIEIAELKAEVARLRSAPPVAAVGPQEVAELKAALRTLAERFIGDDEEEDSEADALPLAERIRVFKAQRDAAARRPLRIAGPANGSR